MKKIRIAALALLLTTTLTAQTVDPNELTYGPFVPGPRDRSTAVALAPHGMLLAWSELSPVTGVAVIRTALLDFNARPIGEVNTLPPLRDTRPATSPSIATDGETFFVAWVERDPYTYTPRGTAGVVTDGSGKPVESTRPLPGQVPVLFWDGLGYRFHENATRRVPFATPEANGWVDWLPLRPDTPGMNPSMPTTLPFQLDWAIVTPHWIRTGRFREYGYTGTQPGVSADGSNLLIVWGTSRGLKALRVIDGENAGTFELRNRFAANEVPSVAGSLVVFEQNGDIFGSLITSDDFGTPFPISTGDAHDELPRVHAVGPNRYLVTWSRDHGAAISLGARVVTTP